MRAHRTALLVAVCLFAATACQEANPLEGKDPVAVDALDTAADALTIARVATPAGTVERGRSLPGSVGGESVRFTATADDTLAFVVPALNSGTHEGVIELDGDRAGTFTLTIRAADELASDEVEAVIDSAFVLLDQAHARLVAQVAADTTGLRTRTAANLDLIEDYIRTAHSAISIASPSDRRAVARVLLANEDEIHYLLSSHSDAAAVATFLASGATPAECTDEGIKKFAAGLITWNAQLKYITGGGVAIGLLAAAAGATAAPVVVAVGTGALLIGLVARADDVAINGNCAFVAIELLKKEVAGEETSDMFALSASAHASPFVLLNGRATPIEIEARYRTPTTDDTLFAGAVSGLAGVWDDVESMLPSGALAGEPPALPPAGGGREEVRAVEPSALELESVSDPVLACIGVNDHVQLFEITCIDSDTLTVERHFTFTLRHAAGEDTLSAVFEAVLAPVRGAGAATLSTIVYDSNGQLTKPLTMTMSGESYFSTREYHDGTGSVFCEIVLTVAEATGTRAARMATLGPRREGTYPLANRFEATGPAYTSWNLGADFPLPELAIAEYYSDWSGMHGTVTITRASELEIVGTIEAEMGRFDYGEDVIRTGTFNASFRAVNSGGSCPALGNG